MTNFIKWLDHNSNTVFAFIAALANVTLWVMAGEMAEGTSVLARISSASLGSAMSFGLWGIFRKTAGLQLTIKARGKTDRDIPNPRFWLPASAGGIVMLVEIALLSAVIVARARAETLNELMPGGWLWAWSAGRVASAGLVLVALAVTGGAKREESTPKPARSEPKQETEPLPVAIEPLSPAWVCATCGYEAKSQAALSGHQIKHSRSKAEPSGYTLEIKPMENTK